MFIETFKNNGIPYLRLVSGERIINSKGNQSIRKKIIMNIGPLSKFDDGQPDYIKRLKDSFKNGNPLIDKLSEFCDPKPLEQYHINLIENDPDCYGNPKIFSHILIEKILEEIGLIDFVTKAKDRTKISYDIVGFLRLLIYGRILNPCSKIATINQNNDYYNKVLDDDFYKYNIYDTLSFIYKFRNNIVKKINSNLKEKLNRTTDIIYYDVTNFFFEIEKADDDIEIDNKKIKGDRQYGVSKEERSLPIVQMGLFMDEQGIPISIETFPGNTLDHLTAISSLKNTVDNLELSRYVFVGDRGMCTYKTICHLIDRNNGYVISKSIEKSTNEEKQWILNQDDYNIKSDNFKIKSRIIKRKVKDENNKEREIVEKVVVYWSKEFEEKEKAMQKSFLEFLNKFINSPETFKITSMQYKSLKPFLKREVENIDTGELLNSSKLKAFVDEDKIKSYIGHMGYYQIVTSETKKSDEEIIEIYHGLSQIENQFRLMKGVLDTRPIYVRTHEHIYSHLLICMISLVVIRIIQNQIVKYKRNTLKEPINSYWAMGLEGNRLQSALNKWTVDKIEHYYRFNNISQDKDLALILDAFNIKIPMKLFKKAELRHIKQTIELSV